MQLKPLAFALLAACTPTPAWAQPPSSSITIFGRADMGLVRLDDGAHTTTRADSGRYTESRWGIRGVEDLGGGLAAILYLESGVSIDTGQLNQGGRLFGRGAYIGLLSSSWGQLSAGRQYVPLFWPLLFGDDTGRLRLHTYSATQMIQRGDVVRINQAASPVTGAGSLDTAAGGIYAIGSTSAFEDNQIVYRSAPIGGATVMLAHGTGAENASNNSIIGHDLRVRGANVEWRPPAMPDLYLGAAWNEKKGQRAIGSTLYEQTLIESAITGQYVLGTGFSIWGNYHPFELTSGPQRLQGSDHMIGLSYRLPTGMVWGNYSAKSVSDCNGCGARGFGIGYHRHLSNRSELYAFYGKVDNAANSALGIGGVNPSTVGKDPAGYGVGIAHQF